MMRLLLLALLIAIPVKTEHATFKILQDGKRIGEEDFSITGRPDGYLAEGRTRIRVGNESLELKSRMELDLNLKPRLYEFQSGTSSIRLKIEKPVSELETIVDGKSTPYDIRFPEDGAIVDDNFFHHYLLLLYRSANGTDTVSVFVPQQMALGSISIRKSGNNNYELETTNLKLSATTDADRRLIRLSVPDAKVIVER